MMNSPMVAAQAESLADRILTEDFVDDAARISFAYEICFARPAEESEIHRAMNFLALIGPTAGPTESVDWPPAGGMGNAAESMIDARHHAWRSLCKVLIASNEFIYVR